MSNQQKKREQLKQQPLDQIKAQQEGIESLSDEELESVAGGYTPPPTSINTGPTSINTGTARAGHGIDVAQADAMIQNRTSRMGSGTTGDRKN